MGREGYNGLLSPKYDSNSKEDSKEDSNDQLQVKNKETSIIARVDVAPALQFILCVIKEMLFKPLSLSLLFLLFLD